MTRRSGALFVAGTVLTMSSCAAIEAQKEGAQGIARASDVACVQARADLESALEAYTILNGGPPADEAALVPDYLRVASALMDIDPQGNVVASPGGGCT
jgi:hypothetical protein